MVLLLIPGSTLAAGTDSAWFEIAAAPGYPMVFLQVQI